MCEFLVRHNHNAATINGQFLSSEHGQDVLGRSSLFRRFRKIAISTVVLAASLAAPGCVFNVGKKKPRAFVPPPVITKPIAPLPDPVVTMPDDSLIIQAESILPAAAELPQVPPPPVAPPKRPQVVATPKPPPPAPVAEKPPEIRLTQIFTPEQQREYNRQIDESLDSVRRLLAVIEKRSLSSEQNQIADTVRAMQKQAEQAREQDLVTAVNLARRADLLAKDLIQRLP